MTEIVVSLFKESTMTEIVVAVSCIVSSASGIPNFEKLANDVSDSAVQRHRLCFTS